ncbi:hypothetical protein UlMin_010830 [Ulmus minor]
MEHITDLHLHLCKKLATLSLPKTTQSHYNLCSLSLPQTHSSSKHHPQHVTTHPYQNHSFILQFHSSTDNNEKPEREIPKHEQVGVVLNDHHYAFPHIFVLDIWYIDWVELHRKGFQGLVFDKDNTITIPYSLAICNPLGPSIGNVIKISLARTWFPISISECLNIKIICVRMCGASVQLGLAKLDAKTGCKGHCACEVRIFIFFPFLFLFPFAIIFLFE